MPVIKVPEKRITGLKEMCSATGSQSVQYIIFFAGSVTW